eukprot:g70671.t1
MYSPQSASSPDPDTAALSTQALQVRRLCCLLSASGSSAKVWRPSSRPCHLSGGSGFYCHNHWSKTKIDLNSEKRFDAIDITRHRQQAFGTIYMTCRLFFRLDIGEHLSCVACYCGGCLRNARHV